MATRETTSPDWDPRWGEWETRGAYFFYKAMWHDARPTARQFLARGCHDNRQTDANGTPSPQILNGCRVFDWTLRSKLDPCPWPPGCSRACFVMPSCLCMANRGLLAALTGSRRPASRQMHMLHIVASVTHGDRQSNGPERSSVRSRSRDLSTSRSFCRRRIPWNDSPPPIDLRLCRC